MKISVGADPEVFLVDKKGKFVSAHNLIPGTKHKPHKVKMGAVQVDGTAAEFNINPCFSSDDFCKNIESVLGDLRKMIPPELEFKYHATAQFLPKYFKELPDDCKVLGCDPDYDSRTGQINQPPAPKENIRHGGGHIHIGWTEGKYKDDPDHHWDCEFIARYFTNYLAGFSAIWDTDYERRKLCYAWGYRPKPYGVELRSLSNAWLQYPKLWPWLFETVQVGVNNLSKGVLLPSTAGYVDRYYDKTRLRDCNIQADRVKMPRMPDIGKVEQPAAKHRDTFADDILEFDF